MPDLPVAAPDHEAMRLRAESQCSHFHAGSGVGDTWCDRCGKPLNRWDEKCDYQLDAAHLLAEDVLALLAERRQDKERIERLAEVLKAAELVAELNGEARSSYGRTVTHAEWANAMFHLETVVVGARAALAVEEDTENG